MVNPRLTHVFSEGDVFFCDFRLLSLDFLLEIRCRRNWKRDQKSQKMDKRVEKIKPEPPIGASVPLDGSILILSTCSVIGPWDG